MEALGDLLASVLSDPEKLSQITSVAESLGLSATAPEQSPPPPGALESTELLSSFLKLAEQAERQDPHQAELLRALRPFLRPERRPALDRAVRAARLSSLATLALRALQEKNEPEDRKEF
ncbi:MAG: hypothetical protein MJ085_02465 [Clostridia bacterium]|nr:hypothetical protein [Clostridia bacterium]